MIKEMAFVCYPVKDLKKARAFYEDVLGLKATSVFESEKMGFIEYDIGATTFAIGFGSEKFSHSKDGACVAFEVDDFKKTITELKQKGVKIIMEPEDYPTCSMAMIEDPDGSKLVIHKRKEN